MKPLLFMTALSLASVATADNIVIQNVCGVTGFASVTMSSGDCSIGTSIPVVGSTPYATSSAHIGLTLSASPAEYSVLTPSQHTSAFNGGRDLSSAGASSTINAEFDLTTAGPVRAGFLQAVWEPTSVGGSTDGTGGSFAVIMRTNDFYSNGGLSCSYFWPLAGCLDQQSLLGHFTRIPFTLGEDFEIRYVSTVNSGSYRFVGHTGAMVEMNYKFRLFEADGETPVAVLSAAPEPSAWALLLAGCSLLIAKRARPRLCPRRKTPAST
jgi:hypothetical protein